MQVFPVIMCPRQYSSTIPIHNSFRLIWSCHLSFGCTFHSRCIFTVPLHMLLLSRALIHAFVFFLILVPVNIFHNQTRCLHAPTVPNSMDLMDLFSFLFTEHFYMNSFSIFISPVWYTHKSTAFNSKFLASLLGTASTFLTILFFIIRTKWSLCWLSNSL